MRIGQGIRDYKPDLYVHGNAIMANLYYAAALDARLANSFDPLGDIPIGVWQREWAPSRSASWDAFSRLTGLEASGRSNC